MMRRLVNDSNATRKKITVEIAAARPKFWPESRNAIRYVYDTRMSVVPAGILVLRKSGRPLVSSEISTKLLKLKANAEISSGDSGLTIIGAVILKKLVNGLAPAMAEASYRSTGMALSRPVHSTRKYGYPSQVLTSTSIRRARLGSANQAGLMPNSALRMPLISPKFWLNRPLKTRMEMKPGTA